MGAEGKPFNFQTPPLFQILIATLFRLVGTKDLILPLLSILFSCLTLYLVFHLVKRLFSSEEAIYAIIIFIFTEFFLFFSKSGLSDATFLFLFTASIFFFIKGVERDRTSDFLLTGVLTTLALYTKYSAASLLIIFIIIGFLCRKHIQKKWFIFSVIIPIVLFCPYIYLFIRFVQIPEIGARHVSLMGINHIKFLLYLFTFAPVPLILSLTYIIVSFKKLKKWDLYIFIIIITFFAILGFYYPFFRLLYPLIPLFSIAAARFIAQTGRYKIYLLVGSVLLSCALGMQTITYKSDVPKNVAGFVDHYAKEKHIHYIYTVVPPNIYFYINGSIAVSSNHPWFNIGKKFPVLMQKKKIIYPRVNELLSEKKVILVHATATDSIKQQNSDLYKRGTLLNNIEFIDAPVYYKDIYNPQRNIKQMYEIYLFDIKSLADEIDTLWKLGFNRQVEVIVR